MNRKIAQADRLAKLNAVPFWNTSHIATAMGGPRAEGYAWSWNSLRPEFDVAIKTRLAGPGAERRIIILQNPGMPTSFSSTHTLNGALQMILPGEVAPAHRHTYAALRFILEGSGAYTVVNGVRVDMHKYDLLLTPAMFWHSHTQPGNEPMVWFDALDAPFVSYQRAEFFEPHPSGSLQPYDRTVGESDDLGKPGMLPGRMRARAEPANSPQLIYKWEVAERCIASALANNAVDQHEGAVFEYVNPDTGGHVMPTIACYAQGFRAGFHSLARRRTSSSMCVVTKGRGATIIDGRTFEWTERDVIAEPSSSWCEYVAYEDAAFFRVSDQPLLEPFGLLRVEDHPKGRQSP